MIHLNMNNFKFNKIFIEIRYKEVFSLPEKKYKILEKFAHKFQSYDSNSLESITFVDHDKEINFQIHINRIIIDWDKPNNIEEFNKICTSYVNEVRKILNIQSAERIGCRIFYTNKVDSEKEVSSYIINKFFANNAKPTELIADEVLSPAIKFSGRKGTNYFNLAISYQQEQVIQGQFNGPVNSVENHNFLADLDVYRQNYNLSRVKEFISEVNTFANNNLISYLKSVEGVLVND